MSITASKYINNSDLKTSYIGLFNYKSHSRGRQVSFVDMYGLLFFSSEVEIPGDKLAKFAWDGMVDGFEYSKTDSTNESLKLGLTEATRRVKQLIINDPNIGKYGVEVNFTIFVSSNRGVYIGLLGESDIFVYKDGRLIDICEMLKKKNAKTAAVAIEEGDLIFCASTGYIKGNMQRLISAKNRNELVSVLEELGKEIGDDTGIVVLTKEKDIEEKDIEIKTPITNIKRIVKGQEPSDTDYVPTVKSSNKIFKVPGEEKDLKEVINTFLKKLSFLKTVFRKFSEGAKPFLQKISKSISSIFLKVTSRAKVGISNRLGKKRWYKKVSATVSQSTLIAREKEKFKEFKIDGYKQRGTRVHRVKILILVLLGISLLVGGVKFTIDQKEAREVGRNANEIFTSVQKLIADAQSKLGTDRESSELYIVQASDKLSKLPDNLGEKDLKKYQELNGQVLGIQDSLYKIKRLSLANGNIEKYYDSFNSNQDSKLEDIAIYRDKNGSEYLVITDLGAKSVYTISLYDRKVESIGDSNKVLEKPYKVYTRDTGVFVLDLSSGILKAKAIDGGFEPFIKLSGLSIQNIGADDISEFAVLTINENAYVLDRAEKTLLKSTNYSGGYSLAAPYLSKEEYAKSNDVFSDLSVYILAEGENGVYRYVSSGGVMVEAPINLKGLDHPIQNAKYGFTIDDMNSGLYIFDEGDRRVLRFEKPMESGEKRHPNELLLLNQYIFEDTKEWESVKDIVVDFKEENMYILDGTTIWKVRL